MCDFRREKTAARSNQMHEIDAVHGFHAYMRLARENGLNLTKILHLPYGLFDTAA